MRNWQSVFLPLALLALFTSTPFSPTLPQRKSEAMVAPEVRPVLLADELTVSFTLLNDDQVIAPAVLTAPGYIGQPTMVERANVKLSGWYLENTLSNEFVFETTLVTTSLDLFARWEHIGSNDKALLSQSPEGTSFTNGDVTLSLNLYLTDTVTYQWEYKRDENDTWGPIVGETQSSFVPRSDGTHGYRCVYRYFVDDNGVLDDKRRESESVWLTLTGGFDWTPIYLAASAVGLVALALFLTWPTPIVYDTNGGTPLPNTKAKAFSDITLQPIPVKTGYVFDGWFLDKALTKPFNLVRASRKKIRLYARWIKP